MKINNEDLRHHVHQFNSGLINAIEFLLMVQVSPEAVQNLLIAAKLPAAAQVNLDVGDLMQSDDEVIEDSYAKTKALSSVEIGDDETPTSLKIEYAKELLDWMGIMHTSAKLRSFCFYRFEDGFGIGIYTSDTNVRSSLRACLKEGKLPFTETTNEVLLLSAKTLVKASNLKPPRGMRLKEIPDADDN